MLSFVKPEVDLLEEFLKSVILRTLKMVENLSK